MADQSWDNSGLPPKKPGMPLGAKIALGCGGLFLLGLVAIATGGSWYAQRSLQRPEVRRETGQALYPLIHRLAQDLQTDEGAKAYYHRHAGLVEHFPTDQSFVAATTPWRPRLAALPETAPPDLDFRMTLQFFRPSRMAVRLPDGDWFRLSLPRRGRTQKDGPRELPVNHLEIAKEP